MSKQTALQNRTAAAATLAEAMRELSRYKDKGSSSMRLLKTKYENVLAAKRALMDKHFVYADIFRPVWFPQCLKNSVKRK